MNGVTISHAWQCIDPNEVYKVAAELNRILVSGGIVRVTDDNTESSSSPKYMELAPGAKNWTGPRITANQLKHAGFAVTEMEFNKTNFPSPALRIWHREHKRPKYTFYLEAQKAGKVKYKG